MTQFELTLRLHFEIWDAGADFDATDTIVKTIAARLASLIRIQTFSSTVDANSTQLDTFCADGDVENEGPPDFEYFGGHDGGWLVLGTLDTQLTLLSTT